MQLKKEYVNLLLGQIKLASSRPRVLILCGHMPLLLPLPLNLSSTIHNSYARNCLFPAYN